MGLHKWINLRASHQINPALSLLKVFNYNKAMLIPEMRQNYSLMKFVPNGEVYRTFFLLLCFNCHVVSSICIISAV